MKRLAVLCLLSSVLWSCSGPDSFVITSPNGMTQTLTPTPWMLGGKRTVMYEHADAYGRTAIAISQDNEKSFDSAVSAMALLAGQYFGRFFDAKEAEDILSATVSRDKIAAGLSRAELQAALGHAEIASGISREAIRAGAPLIPR